MHTLFYEELKKDQTDLDNLKNICQCNISLCFYRLSEFRQAIGVATKALAYMPNNSKALYHRSRAYRALDEYEHAMKDLEMAKELDPNNASVRSEIASLKSAISASNSQDKKFASNVLNFGASLGVRDGSRNFSSINPNGKGDSKIAFVFDDDALPLEPNLCVNSIKWVPKTEDNITPEAHNLDVH